MRHVLLALLIGVNGCSERPVELGSADYPYNMTPAYCAEAIPAGAVGIHNDEKTPTGIKYSVRTPSNYDPETGHPLLMVYPGAGQSRFAAEAFTGLTTAATDAGFIVAYSDHRPLSVPVIEDLARIPRAIAEKWCVDENRVYLTGHSDGGTVAMAIAFLPQTRGLAAGIAPSASGVPGADLDGYECPAPLRVRIAHGANDTLFPGHGAEAAAWWATCNRCDSRSKKPTFGACIDYQACATDADTRYCEHDGSHRDWPHDNNAIIEFFSERDPASAEDLGTSATRR